MSCSSVTETVTEVLRSIYSHRLTCSSEVPNATEQFVRVYVRATRYQANVCLGRSADFGTWIPWGRVDAATTATPTPAPTVPPEAKVTAAEEALLADARMRWKSRFKKRVDAMDRLLARSEAHDLPTASLVDDDI